MTKIPLAMKAEGICDNIFRMRFSISLQSVTKSVTKVSRI